MVGVGDIILFCTSLMINKVAPLKYYFKIIFKDEAYFCLLEEECPYM